MMANAVMALAKLELTHQQADWRTLAGRPEGEGGAEAVYDSYDALLLEQHKQGHVQEFPTFDAALDEFYSKARTCTLLFKSLHPRYWTFPEVSCSHHLLQVYS